MEESIFGFCKLGHTASHCVLHIAVTSQYSNQYVGFLPVVSNDPICPGWTESAAISFLACLQNAVEYSISPSHIILFYIYLKLEWSVFLLYLNNSDLGTADWHRCERVQRPLLALHAKISWWQFFDVIFAEQSFSRFAGLSEQINTLLSLHSTTASVHLSNSSA